MNPDFVNPLVLAYLGDGVLETMVREYLIKESEVKKVNELYQKATHYVSSKAHQDFILYLMDIEFLSEEEISVFKRARNTKNHKKETKEHKYSTGFEALIGYLYLKEEHQRIQEIFEQFKIRVKQLEGE